MAIQELFNNITERIQTTASVKAIYGDPITAEGKTIIPVARVRYGFGGGGGIQQSDPASDDGEQPHQNMSGGGGGGCAMISPVGIIEITAGETRYISFEERRTIIKAVLLGSLVGMFLWRRRRRG